MTTPNRRSLSCVGSAEAGHWNFGSKVGTVQVAAFTPNSLKSNMKGSWCQRTISPTQLLSNFAQESVSPLVASRDSPTATIFMAQPKWMCSSERW